MFEIVFLAGVVCGMLFTGLSFSAFLFLFPAKGTHG